MKIAGIQKFTLTDYPGEIACVIFLSGCNLRCPWCHNPELVFNNENPGISEEEVKQFLQEHKGKLTGVVISGGEPTIWEDELVDLVRLIHDMGFKVKLDTNGSNFYIVFKLIMNNLIDYIGVDLKCTAFEYKWLSPKRDSNIFVDLNSILCTCGEYNVNMEVRTTAVRGYLGRGEMLKMAEYLQSVGVKRWIIQPFQMPENGVLDKSLTRGYIGKSQLEDWREWVTTKLDGEKPFVIDIESRYT